MVKGRFKELSFPLSIMHNQQTSIHPWVTCGPMQDDSLYSPLFHVRCVMYRRVMTLCDIEPTLALKNSRMHAFDRKFCFEETSFGLKWRYFHNYEYESPIVSPSPTKLGVCSPVNPSTTSPHKKLWLAFCKSSHPNCLQCPSPLHQLRLPNLT